MGIGSKQIDRILAAPVRVSGFSATGASSAVTSVITTALATAGDGGVSVPLQPSTSSGLGVITTGTNNRVEIYDATSKDKILSSAGEEVYGRLTESGGVYTLTYYYLSNAGTETSYTGFSSTSIDFEFNYRFDFYRFPTDGAISLTARNISNDPAGTAGKIYREKLTVTATNTVSNLTKTPSDTTLVTLVVNGVAYDTFTTAAFTASTSNKTITWSSSNAGFSLETTDRVIANYVTFE